MKYIKFFFTIIILINLNSCGFKKINSNDKNTFRISNLELSGDKVAIYKLRNNLVMFSANNSKNLYDLKINLVISKNSKIKNTAGITTRFNNLLIAEIEIKNIITNKLQVKKFVKSSDFNTADNYSTTLRREKNSLDQNIKQISEEIIKYISLLNDSK